MLGYKFIKVQPTDFIMQFKRGKLTREGQGLAFFYFRPTTSLVVIPLATTDVPFIFEAVTIDYQEVTLQGQLTYRISDPKKLSQLMNYSLAADGRTYAAEDWQKLPQRLINHVQVLTRSRMKTLNLREALNNIDSLVEALDTGMKNAEIVTTLGIEVLGLSLLAVKPTPETARALEAEAREQILREADEAVYTRRNASVEQERNIKENELNTEIAVENKKRQIRETQMEAEKAVQLKKKELDEARMKANIALEEMNQDLTKLATQNARAQADAKAYALSEVVKAIADVDPRNLQSLANVGLDSGQLVALAFRELAQNATKIGQLNVSPDLLSTLLDKPETRK